MKHSIGIIIGGLFRNCDGKMSGLDRWSVNYAIILAEHFDVTVYSYAEPQNEYGIKFVPISEFDINKPKHHILIGTPFNTKDKFTKSIAIYKKAGCEVFAMLLCEPPEFNPVDYMVDGVITLREDIVEMWRNAYPSVPVYLVPNTVDNICTDNNNRLDKILISSFGGQHKRFDLALDIVNKLGADYYVIDGSMSRQDMFHLMQMFGIFLATSKPNTEIDMTMGLEAVANGCLLVSSEQLYTCFEDNESYIEVTEGEIIEETAQNFINDIEAVLTEPVEVKRIIENAQQVIYSKKSFAYLREYCVPFIYAAIDNMEPIVLDLGCGMRGQVDRLSIDKSPLSTADIIWDLENGIPIPDSICKEVHAYYMIEHLSDTIGFMNEIHRVCQPGARVFINTVHYTNELAYGDPGHKKYFSEAAFFCFNMEEGWYNDYGILYGIQPWHLDKFQRTENNFMVMEFVKPNVEELEEHKSKIAELQKGLRQ